LKLLADGRRHVGRLQAIGNIATHGDGRHAVAAPDDWLFHAHVDLAQL
jgi:hypothetical protein